MEPPRLRDGHRWRTYMPEKETSKMSRADAEALGQVLRASLIQRAFAEQSESPRDGDR